MPGQGKDYQYIRQHAAEVHTLKYSHKYLAREHEA